MKLNHIQLAKKEEKAPKKRSLPVALLVSGLMLASPAFAKDVCTSVHKNGNPSIPGEVKGNDKTPKSMTMNILDEDTDGYVQVTLSGSYPSAIYAKAMEQSNKATDFLRSVLKANIETGIASAGKKKKSFPCASLDKIRTEDAASALPQPAPEPSAPEVVAATSVPDSVPAASSSGLSRRRTTPTPEPVESTIELSRPLPVSIKGGKGTDKDPFVLRIPVAVSDESKSRNVLYKADPCFFLIPGGKLYFSPEFIAEKSSIKTSKSQLVDRIASEMARQATKIVQKDDRNALVNPQVAKACAETSLDSAGANEDISAYLPQ